MKRTLAFLVAMPIVLAQGARADGIPIFPAEGTTQTLCLADPHLKCGTTLPNTMPTGTSITVGGTSITIGSTSPNAPLVVDSPYGHGGPPAGFFPQAMPNMASRYETYCLAGTWPCVEVFVREYGQTCHAPVKGGSPYYDGFIPPGFTYTRWRCTLSPDQAVGGVKVSGEGYDR